MPVFIKSLQRFNDFISIQCQDENKKNLYTMSINKIVIKKCSFNLTNKVIFSDLNLMFKQNNIIIGASGIGKTSLLLLITQKYLDFKGKILINNEISLNQISYQSWQKICIYLSSNSIIYSGTVLENILSFHITKEKLTKFEKLKFNDILISLGLTSFYYCQEYGTNLSQGQRQIIIFLSLFFTIEK